MEKIRKNSNHPKQGSQIKVEPIRAVEDIESIKLLLAQHPRDLCLFVLGINTAYRANELLSITCGQVRHLRTGGFLTVMQDKTNKYRSITLNRVAVVSIQKWLLLHPNPASDIPLFMSRKGGALTVPAVSKMVKHWCAVVGISGNYASHTMRKTWGFHQLRRNRTTAKQMVLPILMLAYGHSRQQQTLEYLCVQSEDVAELYLQMEL